MPAQIVSLAPIRRRTAAPALQQQRDDQSGLRAERQQHQQRLPPVALQERRLEEADLAAFRQQPLTEIEARERVPDSPVLILSQYVEERYASDLIAGGASGVGYLLKERVADVGEFVANLRAVADGGTVLDPEVVKQILVRRRRDDRINELSEREKEVLGFFISGHPLERFRDEVELFGTRTTATLGEWSEHQAGIGAVVTAVKRQISKKTGKEYARLVLEDFHGTAEAIVFPDAWAKLNQIIVADAALLLTGGYSDRDRGEDHAPFIVESARRMDELKTSGAVALSLRWGAPSAPRPEVLQQAAAICSAHPGPTPLYIEWSDGNGEAVRLRSRRVRVAAEEDLVRALRDLLGADSVHYVKAG